MRAMSDFVQKEVQSNTAFDETNVLRENNLFNLVLLQ